MLHLIGKNLWARRYRNGWVVGRVDHCIYGDMGTD